MAERAVELLWNAIELAIDALTWALRFLFGDPRPVSIPQAGASFHDPDRELN